METAEYGEDVGSRKGHKKEKNRTERGEGEGEKGKTRRRMVDLLHESKVDDTTTGNGYSTLYIISWCTSVPCSKAYPR